MMWNVQDVVYKINDEVVGSVITREDVLSYARRYGYQNFNVLSEDGRYLTPDDFPYSGNVRVIPIGKLG